MNHQGNIYYINNNLVKGWASLQKNQTFAYTVNLYINNALVKSALANEFIPKLKNNKVHKTGKCGFTFNLDFNIKNGDEVDVKIVIDKKEFSIENTNPIYYKEDFDFDEETKKKIEEINTKFERTLIIGLQKSGTTALMYKVASSIKDASLKFEPNKQMALVDVNMHKNWLQQNSNLVSKCLFYPTVKNYIMHISKLYKKNVWIVRDPRDQIISAILYRWFWSHKFVDRNKFKPTFKLLQQKEKNPQAVNFIDIVEQSFNLQQFKNAQKANYNNFIREFESYKHNNKFYFFKYDDLIGNNFEDLENYLEFKVEGVAIENKTTKRVKRTAKSGNYKNWFTEKDIEFFKPIYNEFLQKLDFDNDWTLNKEQFIDKKTSSEYVLKLFTKPTFFGRLKSKFF